MRAMRVIIWASSALLLGSLAGAQPADAGTAGVRGPLRRLPRQRRQRRRARTGAFRRGCRCEVTPIWRRFSAPGFPGRACRRSARSPSRNPRDLVALPAHAASACRNRTGARKSRARRRPLGRRAGPQPQLARHAAARRRSEAASASQERQRISARDLADRLDELQRPGERQPLQPARANHQGQRREARAEVDLQPPEHGAAAGDAGGRRRRDVRHQRERVLRARRGDAAGRSGAISVRGPRA